MFEHKNSRRMRIPWRPELTQLFHQHTSSPPGVSIKTVGNYLESSNAMVIPNVFWPILALVFLGCRIKKLPRNPYCRYCEVEACAKCVASRPGDTSETATQRIALAKPLGETVTCERDLAPKWALFFDRNGMTFGADLMWTDLLNLLLLISLNQAEVARRTKSNSGLFQLWQFTVLVRAFQVYHRRQPVFPGESSKLLAFCMFEVETCEKCMPGYTLSLGSRPMLLDENVYIYISIMIETLNLSRTQICNLVCSLTPSVRFSVFHWSMSSLKFELLIP